VRGTEVELEEGEVLLLVERREAEEVVRGAAVGVGPEGRVGAAAELEEEWEVLTRSLAMGATATLGLEEASKEEKKSSSGAAEAEEAGATLVTPSMKRLLGNLGGGRMGGQEEGRRSAWTIARMSSIKRAREGREEGRSLLSSPLDTRILEQLRVQSQEALEKRLTS